MKFRSSIGTIEHGSALCGELKQFLIENEPEYGASLVPNLSHISFLAKNNTGIDIDDVTHLVGNEYQLKYRYKWSIYNGCADLDGEESTTVSFTMDDLGSIKFNIHDNEARDTLDEF
ncbi:hypothetical protein [Enterovibrio norvegicus]|uniref:hypothetical protein n=1 Tax=Enterovibrio norvegicus TaxID=188144 RepID=UPI0010BECDF5|nr:hypothetical protein [Enterovibrio norvegicus]TKF35950.1 hypothetical protein FCV83_03905 [Enterovibrio norvegicus]